ncbi:MAG: LuxR C-terminal-related transcriptional regulator, partial [Chloroflexota bacterium]
AQALASESVALAEETADERTITFAVGIRGVAMLYAGDQTAAAALYARASSRLEHQEDRQFDYLILYCLGEAAWLGQDYERAKAIFEQALELESARGDRWAMGLSLLGLARVAHYQGRLSAARPLYEECLAIWRELGDTQQIATTLCGLGELAIKCRDLNAARSPLAQSLGLRRKLGLMGRLARSIEAVAAFAAALGHDREAALLSGAMSSLRVTLRAPLQPAELGELERSLQPAHQRLGEEVWLAAYDRGRRFSLDDAVCRALTVLGVGETDRPDQIGGPILDGGRATVGSARLSRRETEVLRLLAKGLTNKQIADQLVLSSRTVDRHVANLFEKAGVRTRAEATAYAFRSGLVTPQG